MSGHVFVVRGDLTRFACDAWLIPTGRSREVTEAFWSSHDGLCGRLEAAGAFLATGEGGDRSAAREAWGGRPCRSGRPGTAAGFSERECPS